MCSTSSGSESVVECPKYGGVEENDTAGEQWVDSS